MFFAQSTIKLYQEEEEEKEEEGGAEEEEEEEGAALEDLPESTGVSWVGPAAGGTEAEIS